MEILLRLYTSSCLSLTPLSLRLHCIDGWRNRLITTTEVCFQRDGCPGSNEQEVNGTHQLPRACETSFTDRLICFSHLTEQPSFLSFLQPGPS